MAGEAIELFIHSQGAKPTVAVAGPQRVIEEGEGMILGQRRKPE